MTIRFETYGIREAIAELRKYDRSMYEVIVKDLRDKGQPLASKVADAFPMQPFRRVSNWRTEGRSKNGFPHITVREFEQGSDQRSPLPNLKWVAQQGFIV